MPADAIAISFKVTENIYVCELLCVSEWVFVCGVASLNAVWTAQITTNTTHTSFTIYTLWTCKFATTTIATDADVDDDAAAASTNRKVFLEMVSTFLRANYGKSSVIDWIIDTLQQTEFIYIFIEFDKIPVELN